MKEINEDEAISLVLTPHLITDALTANICLGFLNGRISDIALAVWERELAASQHLVELLHQTDKSIALKEAEYKISEPYKAWQNGKRELQKLRAYRKSLYDKEEILKFKPRSNGYAI